MDKCIPGHCYKNAPRMERFCNSVTLIANKHSLVHSLVIIDVAY